MRAEDRIGDEWKAKETIGKETKGEERREKERKGKRLALLHIVASLLYQFSYADISVEL
jgi:hypothetical protein